MEKDNSGILLINKPKGLTSHGVVFRIKKIIGAKKVGHAGTLDPMATGLLLVLINKATKLSNSFVGLDKKYLAVLKLGYVSDTYDADGEVKEYNTKLIPKKKAIEKVIKKFMGTIKQVPPMYSAKKVKGQKLYQLAREGKVVKRKAVKITVYDIQVINYHYPELELVIECSSGTYIRSLAEDMGRKLKTGAHLTELERLAIGNYKLDNAINLKD